MKKRVMNINNEELMQARIAKSAEDLFALAKERGIELTEEQGQLYFARLNAQSGELADDELDNVAGGSCENNHEVAKSVAKSVAERLN